MYLNIYRLFPFLGWFQLVTAETIRADLIAGFTGAVIVLPQGVAFATIAGLPPEYGLYTAMVTPIVAALFGSSRHLISARRLPFPSLCFQPSAIMRNRGPPSSSNSP
jgi:SulP family sulfate permease